MDDYFNLLYDNACVSTHTVSRVIVGIVDVTSSQLQDPVTRPRDVLYLTPNDENDIGNELYMPKLVTLEVLQVHVV